MPKRAQSDTALWCKKWTVATLPITQQSRVIRFLTEIQTTTYLRHTLSIRNTQNEAAVQKMDREKVQKTKEVR